MNEVYLAFPVCFVNLCDWELLSRHCSHKMHPQLLQNQCWAAHASGESAVSFNPPSDPVKWPPSPISVPMKLHIPRKIASTQEKIPSRTNVLSVSIMSQVENN